MKSKCARLCVSVGEMRVLLILCSSVCLIWQVFFHLAIRLVIERVGVTCALRVFLFVRNREAVWHVSTEVFVF